MAPAKTGSPMKLGTFVLAAVLVIAAVVVVFEITRSSKNPSPAASGPSAAQSQSASSYASGPLPGAAFHDACGYLSNAEVTTTIGTSTTRVRVMRAVVAAQWQRAPQWTGCEWSGLVAKGKVSEAVQLAVARFPTPSGAASFFNQETTGGSHQQADWRRINGIGTKTLFLPQLSNYPAAEIVVLQSHTAFEIEYFEGGRFRTDRTLLARLEPLAQALLAQLAAPSSSATPTTTSTTH